MLGKGTVSCTAPRSILPSSTQDQHCREQGCCGGMQSETRHSAPQPTNVSGPSAYQRLRALPLLFQTSGATWQCLAHFKLWLCPVTPAYFGLGTWLYTGGSMPWCYLK